MAEKTVLIVDDEASLRDILRFDFEEMGCAVYEAADGVEALTVFAQQKDQVDLIVTDIKMPKKDGYELIIELKKQYSDVPPIVIITGFSDYTERDLIDAGAEKVFKKPLKLDKFFEEMQQSYLT